MATVELQDKYNETGNPYWSSIYKRDFDVDSCLRKAVKVSREFPNTLVLVDTGTYRRRGDHRYFVGGVEISEQEAQIHEEPWERYTISRLYVYRNHENPPVWSGTDEHFNPALLEFYQSKRGYGTNTIFRAVFQGKPTIYWHGGKKKVNRAATQQDVDKIFEDYQMSVDYRASWIVPGDQWKAFPILSKAEYGTTLSEPTTKKVRAFVASLSDELQKLDEALGRSEFGEITSAIRNSLEKGTQ